jgi:hypothetical protein
MAIAKVTDLDIRTERIRLGDQEAVAHGTGLQASDKLTEASGPNPC